MQSLSCKDAGNAVMLNVLSSFLQLPTRTTVGSIGCSSLASSMFILSHDELCSPALLGQIYVQVYSRFCSCCVYPSASEAFKNRLIKTISSANEATSMNNPSVP